METTTVVPHKKQTFVVEDEGKIRMQGRDGEREYLNSDNDFEETFGVGRCLGFYLFCFKSKRPSTRDYVMLQQDVQGGHDQFHNNNESNWFVKRGIFFFLNGNGYIKEEKHQIQNNSNGGLHVQNFLPVVKNLCSSYILKGFLTTAP
ncbi:hypothetical protein MKW94_003619 [Papaver nudicaule]|uniref:Uncharacterized protein n=1 Tax=Papaver nudicaule TaxID=74823 RepID=A0AA41V9W9_PAPNU|nr:hypothetical protein [Papaver nudicaule]